VLFAHAHRLRASRERVRRGDDAVAAESHHAHEFRHQFLLLRRPRRDRARRARCGARASARARDRRATDGVRARAHVALARGNERAICDVTARSTRVATRAMLDRARDVAARCERHRATRARRARRFATRARRRERED
jgi:hypothetical protein